MDKEEIFLISDSNNNYWNHCDDSKTITTIQENNFIQALDNGCLYWTLTPTFRNLKIDSKDIERINYYTIKPYSDNSIGLYSKFKDDNIYLGNITGYHDSFYIVNSKIDENKSLNKDIIVKINDIKDCVANVYIGVQTSSPDSKFNKYNFKDYLTYIDSDRQSNDLTIKNNIDNITNYNKFKLISKNNCNNEL